MVANNVRKGYDHTQATSTAAGISKAVIRMKMEMDGKLGQSACVGSITQSRRTMSAQDTAPHVPGSKSIPDCRHEGTIGV
jgi:hypothetical protein